MPNSQSVTAQEASALITAYSNNPYGSGAASFAIGKTAWSGLLGIFGGPGVTVTVGFAFGRDANGNLVILNYSANNASGAPVTGSAWYVNGSVTTTPADYIDEYAQHEDPDTPNVLGVYMERQDGLDVASDCSSVINVSFARESDDTLNIVVSSDDSGSTVYFNKMRPRPRPTR